MGCFSFTCLLKLILYISKPQNQMCDWSQKCVLFYKNLKSSFSTWLTGFFTFLVALVHGAPRHILHTIYDIFCLLFVCEHSPQWCSIACLKQDYLWFLGKTNYSIFWIWKTCFFSLLSLLLSSNLIEFIIIFYEYRLIRNCHFYWPWWEKKK